MKRLLPVLVCGFARVAAAQITPTAQNSESAYEPQNVEVHGDGRCMTVRPGDTVHYTLTIEGVAGAHAVYGDLRLRLGHSKEMLRGDLPVPDFRSLGGGGLGTHESGEGKMFHFAFKVPQEIYGGTYRGIEVYVRADQPPAPYQPVTQHAPHVDVTRHTRDEIHAYCLNVLSNFGVENRPAVTNFEPGQVDPPAPPAPGPQPLPR